MRELKKPFLILLFLTFLFLSLHYIFFTGIPSPAEWTPLIIPYETPTKKIGEILKEKGIIENKFLFLFATKLFGGERKMKGGKYLLPKGISEFFAYRILKKGGKERVTITIPEGWTKEKIGEVLEKEGVVKKDSFLLAATDSAFLRVLGIPFPQAEGFLFPNTYEFNIPSSPYSIMEKMVGHFFKVYKSLRESIPSPFSDSLVIILASLVEKEAVLDSERPIIAGVFLNRLKKRMKLESCPTVEYALSLHKERLNSIDLTIDSPYNTYLHYGLPPTPICNPGKKSLMAVLRPAKTDYLFFFAA
ncbi:MAG: endolytic transglycosylase MltG, partial [candidate division WOR-3 bacterium]